MIYHVTLYKISPKVKSIAIHDVINNRLICKHLKTFGYYHYAYDMGKDLDILLDVDYKGYDEVHNMYMKGFLAFNRKNIIKKILDYK